MDLEPFGGQYHSTNSTAFVSLNLGFTSRTFKLLTIGFCFRNIIYVADHAHAALPHEYTSVCVNKTILLRLFYFFS